MTLIIYITHKRGNNIYWDCSKKYYDIKEDKIHSTINATIKDNKMKFVNICASTTPSLSTIKWSNNCEWNVSHQ